jgi:hypothetical protein
MCSSRGGVALPIAASEWAEYCACPGGGGLLVPRVRLWGGCTVLGVTHARTHECLVVPGGTFPQGESFWQRRYEATDACRGGARLATWMRRSPCRGYCWGCSSWSCCYGSSHASGSNRLPAQTVVSTVCPLSLRTSHTRCAITPRSEVPWSIPMRSREHREDYEEAWSSCLRSCICSRSSSSSSSNSSSAIGNISVSSSSM